jgi:hypothetical protein
MSPTELREHRRKWEAIASSTAPADRKRVERRFRKFYKTVFKKEPAPLFWAISPRDAKGVRKPLHVKEGEKWYGTDFDTPSAINRTIREIIDELKPKPELVEAMNRIRHPLDIGFRRTWRLFWGSDRPNIGEHNDLRREALLDCCLRDRDPRNEYVRAMLSWLYVVASCNGLYTMDRGVVFTETPEIIRFDDNARLHYEGGPAVRYRDGTEHYCLHGIHIPNKYAFARPDEITLPEVLAERNAEVRMMLISRIGFDKLLGTMRHWTISEANGNRLIEFRVKGTQFLRALHLKWRDKTGDKETVIPVPNRRSYFGDDCPDDIDDCEQVRRWTLGWPKEALAVAET